MHHIDFRGEKVIEIEDTQTILEASLLAGIPHYHECGGNAKCSTCRVLILSGEENLTKPNEKELKLKKLLGFNDNIRLACQTHVTGDNVNVRRVIRDKTDVSLYSQLDRQIGAFQEVGEEKELALFFIDIRNFTPFMEKHLSFDVIHIIRRLFQIFKTAIDNYDGKIIETAGDGLYAVFGFSDPISTAVNHAVEAGKQILANLSAFNENYSIKNFNHLFEVGIGLHAGTVIVGNIGLGICNNLTVMGFPVNLAARLQESTKEVNNSFLISEYACSFLENGRNKFHSQNIFLKGISERQNIYLLGNAYK